MGNLRNEKNNPSSIADEIIKSDEYIQWIENLGIKHNKKSEIIIYESIIRQDDYAIFQNYLDGNSKEIKDNEGCQCPINSNVNGYEIGVTIDDGCNFYCKKANETKKTYHKEKRLVKKN